MELHPSEVRLTQLLEDSLTVIKENALKHRVELVTNID